MEKETNIGMAVFKQICEINELDPQLIQKELQEQSTQQTTEEERAEWLIRAALEHRAKYLIQSVTTSPAPTGGEYMIDADPAAPSFQIREDFVRSRYAKGDAEKIIEALREVQLPVW